MRGFILALLIFVLIICGLFWYSNYTSSALSELTEKLHTVENSILENNTTYMEKAVRTFSDDLLKKSNILGFFCDRHPIDELITESSRLTSHIMSGKYSDAKAELSALFVMLNELSEKAALSLQNII